MPSDHCRLCGSFEPNRSVRLFPAIETIAGERERGENDALVVARHLDDALEHRAVELQRRVRVDDGEQARLAQHLADDVVDVARL